MEVKHTETNRGNKAIIVDGYVYRKINTLKNGNIVYICSVSKNCKKSLTTDSDGVNVVKSRNQHSCKNEPNERKAEARQLRVRLKKQTQDYIKSPAAVVKSELTRIEDSNLQDRDIRNASMALYRHRRKNLITVLESIAPPQAPLERVLTTSQSGEVKMSNLGRIFKYTNCRLIRGGDLITDDLWVRDGIIVNPEEIFFQEKVSADVVVDCKGAIICAGFIDVQINGAFGEDFSNTDNIEDCVSKVAFGILAHGVTSFCPTIVTSSGSTYKQVVPRVKKRNGSEEGAGILGLHLEGPFISKEKRGAHDVDLIQTFNNGMSDVTKIYGEDLSNVAIVTLAPELERSAEVIRELVSRGIKVSVDEGCGTPSFQVVDHEEIVPAHAKALDGQRVGELWSLVSYKPARSVVSSSIPCSNTSCKLVNNIPTGKRCDRIWAANVKLAAGHSVANLIQGEEAVNSGATFITHLFNAMLPFHHRDPGLIGLLTSKRVPSDVPFYGVISDGIHTHPAALRIAYRVDQRGMVLVTDAISAMGLPEGEHRFGSQTMEIKGRRAVIKGTQTLCGSIATMDMCVQHLRKSTTCGTVKALEAATFHPAHFLGITDRKGTLDFGTDADFILLDDDLKVLATYIGGECVWSRQELE